MPTGFPDYYGGLTLPVTVAEGGTGQTTLTAHSVLVGADASKLTLVAPGAAGTVLASNGPAVDPSFQSVPAGALVAGSNIAISGSPPTIAVVDAPIFISNLRAGGVAIGMGNEIWQHDTFGPVALVINNRGYNDLFTEQRDLWIYDGQGNLIAKFRAATHDLTLVTPLAVASGGTGTSTPGLVAGAGISISGAWPNQTITNSGDAYFSAGVLAIAHGGTALSTLGTALQVLRVNSGATALEYHAVDLATAMVTGILPVANGGTGTATPGLVAGSNIAISGAWPNTTVAVVASPTFTNISAGTLTLNTGTNVLTIGVAGLAASGVIYMGNASTAVGAGKLTQIEPGTSVVAGVTTSLLGIADSGIAFRFAIDLSGNVGIAGSLSLGAPLAVAQGGTGTATPALVAGAGISISGSWPNQTITNSDDAYFAAGVLAIAHGGTGATSLAAAGLLSIVASADKTGQTAALPTTTLYTPGAAGMYRISVHIYVANPSASQDRVTASLTYTQNGVVFTFQIADTGTSAGAHLTAQTVQALYVDASTAIKYSTAATLGAGDSYDVHFRLEAI